MLCTRLLCAVVAATSIAVLGCGGDTNENPPPPPPPPEDPAGLAPPEEAAGSAACEGAGKVMAMSQIFLGDTKRDGTPDPTGAWREFGYDLDGRASTKASVGLCKPRAGGAPASVYPDGDEGRDNSFGKNILPTIISLSSDISVQANEAIANGEFTIMLDMPTLGTASDCNNLSTKLYGGADLGMAPKWDGTDQWPLIPELLNNTMDPTSAKIVFPKSYVVKNTWVSGTKGTVKLALSVSGFTISLDINSAVITVDLDESRNGGENGTIAGVIETEQLITEISKVASAFDESFCDPNSPTLQSILNLIRQASDIMKDGTQNPEAECDGISIGLGFNAKAVQLGPVAEPAMPPPDPCAMP
ncbi:hypothetical protein [Polyangium spumosum]|uniref:Lipoprotein n=1 Tax=Polyangium spumosum TaxID=889282 RepID=A0A6N7PKD3_9BACT|nr:hypothetical protein [Polyangium spumosum]MRG90595.1 hypothetical protein [Polyangium spumosum]